MGLREIIEEK